MVTRRVSEDVAKKRSTTASSSLTRFEVAPFRRPDLANTAIAGASDAEIAYFHVARLHQNHSCLRRSGSGRVLDPAYCATSKLTRRVTIRPVMAVAAIETPAMRWPPDGKC